jgi:hypothetical protein
MIKFKNKIHLIAGIAQWLERASHKRQVVGSNPTPGIKSHKLKKEN